MEYKKSRIPIPNTLRKSRLTAGFTQAYVAKYLGIKSTNRISRWERGVAMPSSINLLKLSILYQTLTDQLYFDLQVEHRKELRELQELFSKE